MSFDHWWFSCRLTPAQEHELEARFAAADRQAVLTPDSEAALLHWRAHTERYDAQWELSATPEARLEQGHRYNKFIWAFNLPGYVELGQEVMPFLTDDSNFRFIMIRRCSPGAILWQALGVERAERLPGRMGNLFLRAAQVEAALKQVEQAMAGLDTDRAIERGLALASHSNDAAKVTQVVTHLPEGLRDAASRRMGFMAVARPQL